MNIILLSLRSSDPTTTNRHFVQANEAKGAAQQLAEERLGAQQEQTEQLERLQQAKTTEVALLDQALKEREDELNTEIAALKGQLRRATEGHEERLKQKAEVRYCCKPNSGSVLKTLSCSSFCGTWLFRSPTQAVAKKWPKPWRRRTRGWLKENQVWSRRQRIVKTSFRGKYRRWRVNFTELQKGKRNDRSRRQRYSLSHEVVSSRCVCIAVDYWALCTNFSR